MQLYLRQEYDDDRFKTAELEQFEYLSIPYEKYQVWDPKTYFSGAFEWKKDEDKQFVRVEGSAKAGLVSLSQQ